MGGVGGSQFQLGTNFSRANLNQTRQNDLQPVVSLRLYFGPRDRNPRRNNDSVSGHTSRTSTHYRFRTTPRFARRRGEERGHSECRKERRSKARTDTARSIISRRGKGRLHKVEGRCITEETARPSIRALFRGLGNGSPRKGCSLTHGRTRVGGPRDRGGWSLKCSSIQGTVQIRSPLEVA